MTEFTVPFVYTTTTSRSPDHEQEAETKKVWDEFWEPIIAEAHIKAQEEGDHWGLEAADISRAELAQIQRELADAHTAFRSLSLVYCEITGGMISKPMTLPTEVLGVWNEKTQEWFGRDLIEWLDYELGDTSATDLSRQEVIQALINKAREDFDVPADE